MAGKLVTYFSASSGGVTRKAAERIAREEGAVFNETAPAETYTEDDLYWPNFKCRSIVEMMELPNHPWFVACQFHPEFKSRPNRPHPLFYNFVKASLQNQQK